MLMLKWEFVLHANFLSFMYVSTWIKTTNFALNGYFILIRLETQIHIYAIKCIQNISNSLLSKLKIFCLNVHFSAFKNLKGLLHNVSQASRFETNFQVHAFDVLRSIYVSYEKECQSRFGVSITYVCILWYFYVYFSTTIEIPTNIFTIPITKCSTAMVVENIFTMRRSLLVSFFLKYSDINDMKPTAQKLLEVFLVK